MSEKNKKEEVHRNFEFITSESRLETRERSSSCSLYSFEGSGKSGMRMSVYMGLRRAWKKVVITPISTIPKNI